MDNIPITMNSLLSNEIFIGLVVAALVGSVTYQMKSILGAIGNTLRLLFTVSLTSKNDQDGHFAIEDNLQRMLGTRRRIDVAGIAEESRGVVVDKKPRIIPGVGRHFFWLGWRPAFVDMSVEEAKSYHVPRSLTITVLGRKVSVFDPLLDMDSSDPSIMEVSYWLGGYWSVSKNKKRRAIESVILGGIEQDMLADLNNFYENSGWYHKLGIPYKRGYLFHGIPGSGKTTLAMALASATGKNLSCLSLSDLNKDAELVEAVSSVGKNNILLVEDVDVSGGSIDRDGESEKSKVTLSAFLNCLDGVSTPEGLVFILTTNCKDALDPALVRPGRIDVDLEFKAVTEAQATEAYLWFVADATEEDAIDFAKKFANGEKCFAELQSYFQELA